jgi:hypothetical protein
VKQSLLVTTEAIGDQEAVFVIAFSSADRHTVGE